MQPHTAGGSHWWSLDARRLDPVLRHSLIDNCSFVNVYLINTYKRRERIANTMQDAPLSRYPRTAQWPSAAQRSSRLFPNSTVSKYAYTDHIRTCSKLAVMRCSIHASVPCLPYHVLGRSPGQPACVCRRPGWISACCAD